MQEIIENYILAWNSHSSQERASLMTKLLAEKCLYVDSHLPDTINTREQHCEFIDRFRDKFPDLSLKLSSSPDIHHGYFRFKWQMLKANGDLFTQGSFFGEINEQSQITKLVGFVDENK